MTQLVVLDAGPLGLLAFSTPSPEVERCRRWVAGLLGAGIRLAVPEIADFEVRRELIRMRRTAGIRRLDGFAALAGVRYLPITTAAMRMAAEQWARARRQGRPTADPHALDCDVVVAAQARLAGGEYDAFVVATTNVRHLSLFVPAADWWTITAPSGW